MHLSSLLLLFLLGTTALVVHCIQEDKTHAYPDAHHHEWQHKNRFARGLNKRSWSGRRGGGWGWGRRGWGGGYGYGGGWGWGK